MYTRIACLWILLAHVAGIGFAQSMGISIAHQPDSPLQIVSVSPVTVAPIRLQHGQMEALTYTLENVSDRDIYLWVIQRDYENPPGQALTKHFQLPI